MGSLRDDTFNGFKWVAIERFSVKCVTFLIGILLARKLTPDDYGTIGMLSIFFAVAQTFIDSGFSTALIRKNDRTETDYNTSFYFNIFIGIISYILLFFLAPLISSFFDKPILVPILRVLSVNLFFNSLVIVQIAKLTVAIDFKSQAQVSLLSTLISGIIGLILAYSDFGVWALVFQSVAFSFIRVVSLWISTKWVPHKSFSWNSFSNLFSFGSKLLLSGLLHTLYMNMTTLVIGKFYSSKDLGNFSRGQDIATFPSSNFIGMLQTVTFPILSKIQDDESRLITLYRKYITLSSLVIFFIMFLLAALAKPLILFLLTEKWSESIIYLQVFCFSLMFDHICQLNLNLLQVKGRSDLFLKLEIIKKTISFAILFISIPFGVFAICLSQVLYTQIAVVINTYYTGKLYHLGYWAQVKDFSKYLVFSAISALPAFLLSFTDYPNLLILMIGGVLSLALYVFLLRKDESFNELLTFALQKLNLQR